MSTGLVALLDDVSAIAKAASASVDDIAGQAAKAGSKSLGVVIDDAAVTPRYVVGFAAEREIPIVWKITKGSLKNKLLILLPGALALSFLAPWLITPILMLGGLFLCYEGAEKVYEKIAPHGAHAHEKKTYVTEDPQKLEDQRVASAIKTDLILSAEIMAITLSAIPEGGFWTQAVILAVVGIGITVLVYGSVALIVKADDFGVWLAQNGNTPIGRGLGRGLVVAMPYFLNILTIVGTAAMVWVGGGILLHGLYVFGFEWPEHVIHDVAVVVGNTIQFAQEFVEWLVTATGSGVVGLVVGFALIPVVGNVIAPAWSGLSSTWKSSDSGKRKDAESGH